MTLTKHAKIAASALAVAAVALAPAAAGAGAAPHKKKKKHAKTVTKTVGIHDNYYEPAKLTVRKNTIVKWQWPITTGDTHDVTLKKGPKGVKKSKPCTGGKITKCNKSGSGAIGIKFNPKFNKKGTYNFVCTIHPTTMKVKVVVKG